MSSVCVDLLDPIAMAGHQPVLLSEALAFLNPCSHTKLLDCTFGGGGHARSFLNAAPGTTVTALDCDPEASSRAVALEAEFGPRFRFQDLNFGQLDRLEESGFGCVLFDLGLSSFQLDVAERGFSFRLEGPSDMRLDPRVGQSASEFLEKAPKEEIVRAIRNFGEEKRWRRVVGAILSARGTGVLSNTSRLAALIASVAGNRPPRTTRIHPATKSFQGIRLAVNRELENLEFALPIAFAKLAPGGVMVVISFHSLEDRLVKRFFRRMAGKAEHSGDSLPEQLRHRRANLPMNRPIRPGEEEVARNPRSRSARLRALQKLEIESNGIEV